MTIINVMRHVKALGKRTSRSIRDSVGLRIAFATTLRRHPPVLIFQMGKVASTSVYCTLQEAYRGVVVHTHDLTPDHADWRVRRMYREAVTKRAPVRIISLTREPIGRNLSAFFQNFETLTGVGHEEATFTVEELTAVFLEKYHHDYPLRWFDDNVARLFGIDVYATPFPPRGFDVYKHQNVGLLVLHSELDDRDKSAAIGQFLNLPGFQIEPKNISARKVYGGGYTKFKEGVRLPQSYIDQMCASKYFRHFYDEASIASVRAKWMKRLASILCTPETTTKVA